MRHFGIVAAVLVAVAGVLSVSVSANVVISVPNIDSGVEDLRGTSLDAIPAIALGGMIR
jgi:hypothetical protein